MMNQPQQPRRTASNTDRLCQPVGEPHSDAKSFPLRPLSGHPIAEDYLLRLSQGLISTHQPFNQFEIIFMRDSQFLARRLLGE